MAGFRVLARGARRRRLVAVVALLVLPDLLALEPVIAAGSAAARPRRGVPTLSLPEQELQVPTDVPEPEGVVPTDAELPTPEVAHLDGDELPEPVRELVDQRSAMGEVWENADGTTTVKFHHEPINYQADGASAWERIDNSLVEDPARPGWLRNAANEWTVWFGPISPGAVGGVEIVTDAGTARFAPELATAATRMITPHVGEGEETNTVTYEDVWPGVDLRYTVSAVKVKEDIVVADGAQADFPFVVEGLGLADGTAAGGAAMAVEVPSATTDLPVVTGAQAAEMRFLPLEVLDGEGRLADNGEAGVELAVDAAGATAPGGFATNGASSDSGVVADGAQRLVVSVDEGWLDEQADGDEPVVIDPTVALGASAMRSEKLDPTNGLNEYGCNLGAPEGCPLRVGNSKDSYWTGGDAFWRTTMQFPYWDAIQNKQVLHAGIWLDAQSGGSAWWEEPVELWEANGMDFHHAVCGGEPACYIETQYPGATSGNGYPPDVIFDLTYLMGWWQLGGTVDPAKRNIIFGFKGREDMGDPDDPDQYSFKQFDQAAMVLVLNNRPPAPIQATPQDNALTITNPTPTLSWNPVTDADGEPVKYTAKIATGTDGESGLVATSPNQTGTSWTVPEGVLQDGVTYYWKVFADDTHAWVPSGVRRLTVDRRLGAGAMSPSDSFGGVAANLVTGNVSLAVAAPDMPSVGGGVGVDFVYNAQQQRRGLVGTYREDADQDRVIEGSDPVKLVRTDAQVSFDWTKWDPSPAGPIPRSDPPSPALPHDWYSVRWTGFVTLPAGTWQLGVSSDDGVRLKVNGNTVVDKWLDRPAGPADWSGDITGGQQYPISIDYYEATLGASIKLVARSSGGAEIPVPSTWLSPEVRELPNGWSLQAADMNVQYVRAQVSDGSVTLIGADGSTLAYSRTPSGSYKPPEGVEDVLTVNPDGKVTLHDDAGYTSVFRADGGLDTVTTSFDDRKPAAATNTFDSLGRVATLKDPVSQRQVVLTYADQDGDPDCPRKSDDPPAENNPPLWGATGYQAVNGLLCQVNNWDGTATGLYYKNGLLAYVRNPGDAYWGFSYDTTGRLIGYHDAMTHDGAISGARTDWDKLLTEITYEGSGIASRATTIKLPPALQTDAQRPQRTYAYAPGIGADGMLTGGTATVTRAGVSGTYRSVGYDFRGRGTIDTNAAGQTTTTYWDGNDLQIATETHDGLFTATTYNSRKLPTDVWGPAPKSWFQVDGFGVYWTPKPANAADVPHNVTRYDEGIDGLQGVWWNKTPSGWFDGPPRLHRHEPGPLDETWPPGSLPIPDVLNGDEIAGRFTGEIVFPAPGTYKLRVCAGANDIAALTVNGNKIGDIWAVPNPGCSPSDDPWKYVNAGFPHPMEQRIQIDYLDLSGDAALRLEWAPPNQGWQTVPGSALRPGYDLVTSTMDADGMTVKSEYSDAATGIGPQHGIAVRTITDPAGLNLVETAGFEPVGTGYLRRKTHTLPSGAGSMATDSYYGDTETRDNPCTTASDAANQAGMRKLETSADPDGTGSLTPIVGEAVYDASGRVVAARSGSGTLTDSDWVCTTYDARSRVTEVKYPAFGAQPARTVTNNYKVDPDGAGPKVASPLVTSVTDLAGTVTTEVDILRRGLAYKDVFNNTTNFGYDLVGRETSSSGPVGSIVKTYDNADRLTSVSRGGAVVANSFAYDVVSRLTSVTYPSGGGTAGNNTKGTFDYDPTFGRLKKVTWTSGPSNALVTSDEVVRSRSGNVVGRITDGVDHHAGNDYTYDGAGRLVDAWVPGGRYEYHYFQNGYCSAPDSYKNTDRTGMTVTPTGGSAAQTFYCYDHADRLTAATDPAVGTIAYDAHGNTTDIFGETHTYDSANRHMSTSKGSTSVAYVRDATDRIVERKLNGRTVARYGSTGSGDAPGFTTSASNQVLEVTYSLPGGAMLTTRGAGNVWSYPNIHGDVAAIANQSGVKQGATSVYDPYGTVVAGALPDNSHGNLDYGWLGQHQRPVEHETGLQPIIEMGSRQYSPLLGRFLEVDPVVGGSANAYDYVTGDPVNDTDLDGNRSRKRRKRRSRRAKRSRRSRPRDEYDDDYQEADPENYHWCRHSWRHPSRANQCRRARRVGTWAENRAAELFPRAGDIGKQNAIRHCMWAGGLRMDVGEDAARGFLSRREESSPSRADSAIDWRNNHDGLRIGSGAGSRNEIERMCMSALRAGRLDTTGTR